MPRITVLNKFEPIPPDMIGAVEVDTTSHGSFKDLSPFYLGPISLPSGDSCSKFENFWQFSKVYSGHVINDSLTEDYLTWRRNGFRSTMAERYPMGKGAKPLFSIDVDMRRRLDYISARKVLYIPYYAELVRKTASYAKVYNWFHKGGMNIILRDFDGYNHKAIGMTFKDVVNYPKRPMGHAFVIMAMITGELAFGLG